MVTGRNCAGNRAVPNRPSPTSAPNCWKGTRRPGIGIGSWTRTAGKGSAATAMLMAVARTRVVTQSAMTGRPTTRLQAAKARPPRIPPTNAESKDGCTGGILVCVTRASRTHATPATSPAPIPASKPRPHPTTRASRAGVIPTHLLKSVRPSSEWIKASTRERKRQ